MLRKKRSSCGMCWSVRVAHRKGTKSGHKRVEAEQSSNDREHPVVFGQKRVKMGVGQSDMANNNILCRYCIQVLHPFWPEKRRELPFLAITPLFFTVESFRTT